MMMMMMMELISCGEIKAKNFRRCSLFSNLFLRFVALIFFSWKSPFARRIVFFSSTTNEQNPRMFSSKIE